MNRVRVLGLSSIDMASSPLATPSEGNTLTNEYAENSLERDYQN